MLGYATPTVPPGTVAGEIEIGEVAAWMNRLTVMLLLPEPSSNAKLSVRLPLPLWV
ncbi:hypothetical protein WG628_22280 [Stenotrophomonas maltophilia]